MILKVKIFLILICASSISLIYVHSINPESKEKVQHNDQNEICSCSYNEINYPIGKCIKISNNLYKCELHRDNYGDRCEYWCGWEKVSNCE